MVYSLLLFGQDLRWSVLDGLAQQWDSVFVPFSVGDSIVFELPSSVGMPPAFALVLQLASALYMPLHTVCVFRA